MTKDEVLAAIDGVTGDSMPTRGQWNALKQARATVAALYDEVDRLRYELANTPTAGCRVCGMISCGGCEP